MPSSSGMATGMCTAHSVAIQTADFDTAFDFYKNILQLRVIREPFQFKSRQLAWFDAGTILLELYSLKDGQSAEAYSTSRVGLDHLAFETPDLEVMIQRLADHNIKILKGPLTPPSGDPRQPRVVFVEGPDGEEIQFREPERAVTT